MDRVLTGAPRNWLASATSPDESIPPLRNTPSGTSLTRWSLVDSSRRARVVAATSAGLTAAAGSDRRHEYADRSQYRRRAAPCPSTIKQCAAGSAATSLTVVFGTGTEPS